MIASGMSSDLVLLDVVPVDIRVGAGGGIRTFIHANTPMPASSSHELILNEPTEQIMVYEGPTPIDMVDIRSRAEATLAISLSLDGKGLLTGSINADAPLTSEPRSGLVF